MPKNTKITPCPIERVTYAALVTKESSSAMLENLVQAAPQRALLFVGVKGFRMTLKNPCYLKGECTNEVVLSFELSGNFLEAARSDEIEKTVNYAALCQYCKEILMSLPCHHLPHAASLQSAIRGYSSLIEGGQVHLEGRSHAVFFNDVCLL